MQDFYAMEEELKIRADFISKKMKEMTAKYQESDALNELVMTVLFQGTNLLKQCREHLVLTRETNFRADQGRVRECEAVLTDARDMEQSMAEFHEKFLKYNVPRPKDSASFEDYEERLRDFMEIWKEEARMGRRKGRRSLLEWLQELGEERASTFEEMKTVVIDIGTNVSRLLDQYFWFLLVWTEMETVLRILEEFETALECLMVEGKSIVIDGFLAVVRLTKSAISVEWLQKCYDKFRKRDSKSEEKEKEILWLILREVLRLEVAFRCPDLPMMLTDEVLISMGSHLRTVFGKTLKRANSEMDEVLRHKSLIFIEDRDKKILGLVGDVMVSRINGIWKNLELHPGARSC